MSIAKLAIIFSGSFMSCAAIAQNSFTPPEEDPTKVRVTAPDLDNMKPIAESSIQRMGEGGASFYVRLRTYARMFRMEVMRGRSAMLKGEAEALGLSVSGFEGVINILSKYQDKANDKWLEVLYEACRPVINGQEISDAYAKDAISRLDDSTVRRNALAVDIIDQISKAYDEDIARTVTAQIHRFGEHIDHSKVDQVKKIEALQGGDYRGAFIAQCKGL